MGPLAFLPISENETSVVYSFYDKKSKNINNLIEKYNYKYKIQKIEKIKSFNLKSLSLRSYYHGHILAFGDLLHRIHPLAGQGFNMTIRDVKILLALIVKKHSLGLPLDSSINYEFEKKLRHKNLIFSDGIDLIHEFFQGFVNHSFITLHIDNLFGNNAHHQCESVFKSFSRALKVAVSIDLTSKKIPSTKGIL